MANGMAEGSSAVQEQVRIGDLTVCTEHTASDPARLPAHRQVRRVRAEGHDRHLVGAGRGMGYGTGPPQAAELVMGSSGSVQMVFPLSMKRMPQRRASLPQMKRPRPPSSLATGDLVHVDAQTVAAGG